MKTFNDVISKSPILPFIREAGYAVRGPWYAPKRRLLDYLLIYIQEGSLIVTVNNAKHMLREGEFCLIQPNDLHSLEAKSNATTPFAHFDIFYNENREQSFPTPPGQVDISSFQHLMQPKLDDFPDLHIPFQLQPTYPVVFKETMLRMIGLWLQGDFLNQLEAQHLANELILTILRDVVDFQFNKYNKMQSLNWVISYFSFHLSEPISLEDMAKRAHLSPSRFAVKFKDQYGTSPYHYLLHLRISHAQELLRSTSLSVKEIASHCGFSDIHHFSKTFKKVIGQNPTTYRKEYQKVS